MQIFKRYLTQPIYCDKSSDTYNHYVENVTGQIIPANKTSKNVITKVYRCFVV